MCIRDSFSSGSKAVKKPATMSWKPLNTDKVHTNANVANEMCIRDSLLKEGRLCPTDMVGYLSSGKAGTRTSFLEINVVEDALKHAEDSVLPNSNRYL